MSQQSLSSDHLCENQFRAEFLLPKYWLLWVWFAFLWLLTRLPYPLIKATGRSLGVLLYYVVASRRRITLRNLQLCMPEKTLLERQAIAREVFAGAGMTLFESGLVWWARKSRFNRFFRFEGKEILDQLEGRPVLFFGLHNSCLEMGYAYLSDRRATNVLFRVNDNPLWEYMATRSRQRYGARLIPRKQVKEFLSFIEQGQAGLMAADQDLGAKRSMFVSFFGVTAATVASAHYFSKQTQAAVVFAECFREGRSGYVVKLHLLENYPGNDAVADTQRMNDVIAESIAKRPGQYLWTHKRFKTRPDGEPSIY